MKVYESGEDYLEKILMLERDLGEVRSIDIAEAMGFSKPSVSRAMGILREEEMIIVNGKGHILLTQAGRERAEKILERHELLTSFLEALGVDHATAIKDACRMEHVLSEVTFEKIKTHAMAQLGR